MDGKKLVKKIGFGLLFVGAGFLSVYTVVVFQGELLPVLLAAVCLLSTAFLLFYEVFSGTGKHMVPQQEQGFSKEPASSAIDGEFRLKITKYMKDMESSQKELAAILTKQNSLIQSQMANVEQAIMILSEKQANQAKSIIKFNKENARQLAISERETLEYIMMELKTAVENSANALESSANALSTRMMSEPAAVAKEDYPDIPLMENFMPEEAEKSMEEIGEEELFEVTDLPGDDEFVFPETESPDDILTDIPESDIMDGFVTDLPEPEMTEDFAPDIPELDALEDIFAIEEPAEQTAEEIFEPEDLDLSSLFEEMVVGTEEEQTEEPAPKEEPVVKPLPEIGGDPNGMMSPEDIAQLLSSMGE